MTTTFKMPEPDAYVGELSECAALILEKPFWDATTLYTAQGLRDVLEQAASFCEQNQVSIGRAARGFMEFDKECGGVHQGMDYAKAIRAMIGEIK